MPIYEYECRKCGTFEATQKITDKALSKCPSCKSKVRKLISNTSFQLKGSGWYITDYARKEKPAAKTENGAGSAAETKSDGKKEATPAAKSDSSSSSTSTGTA